MTALRRWRKRALPTGWRYSILAILGVTAFAAGCGGDSEAGPRRAEPTTTVTAGTVDVAAAASLTEAFEALGPELEAAVPGVRVNFTFANSAQLVTQVQQGAPVDVFASADEENMAKLVDSGDVEGSPQPFAVNTLQIVVPAGNPEGVDELADLARPGMTVALVAPQAPAGRYAAEAFAKAGVQQPPASQEADVKAVVQKVALGEADAGIVYATDVRAGGDRVTGTDIPRDHNVRAQYPVAAVKGADNRPGAQAFIDFLRSAPGQDVLRRYGFLPVAA